MCRAQEWLSSLSLVQNYMYASLINFPIKVLHIAQCLGISSSTFIGMSIRSRRCVANNNGCFPFICFRIMAI